MAETPAEPASDAQSLVALADRCVQCGLCLPHCPTYQLDQTEAESPRGRIAYMKATAGAVLDPTETGDRHLDHCLGCLRCESVCPAGVDYGELLIEARAAQRERRSPPLPDRVRLALLAKPGLLAVLVRTQSLLPNAWRTLPAASANEPFPITAGNESAAIFVGCIATAYESSTRAALAKMLQAVGVACTLPATQTCCGTAALHAGETAQAETLAAHNRTAFAGQARVLTLASGCHQQMEASLAGVAEVEDALSFLESRFSRKNFRDAGGRRVALHVPCSQRSAKNDDALRRLLHSVPGLDLVELPDTGCCGAAGTHMLSEPERAAALRAPLLVAFERSAADELLSANIGCRLHLGQSGNIRVRHPIDFLAEHLA